MTRKKKVWNRKKKKKKERKKRKKWPWQGFVKFCQIPTDPDWLQLNEGEEVKVKYPDEQFPIAVVPAWVWGQIAFE